MTALVSGYEWARLRAAKSPPAERRIWTRPLHIFLGIAATSVLAEGATAPIAAYHFNQLVIGGLIANEIAIPLSSFWIMPLAVIAVLAMPFGLEAWPLKAMGWGLNWLLDLSHWTANLPFSVIFMEPWPTAAFALMVFGGLWLALWRTSLRYWGALIAGVALILAVAARGPDIIADETGAFAFRAAGDHGWRYGVVGARASSFKGEAWVRRLGGNPELGVDAKALMRCDSLGCLVPIGHGATLTLVRDGAALSEECASAKVLLSLVSVPRTCTKPDIVVDRAAPARCGAGGDAAFADARHARNLRPRSVAVAPPAAADPQPAARGLRRKRRR